jgi:hypothetical protein
MAPILTRPAAQLQLDHAPQPDTQVPLVLRQSLSSLVIVKRSQWL